MAPIQIATEMAVNADHLRPVEVEDMPCGLLDKISNRIIPTFCYDNSLVALVQLELEKIVYGFAIVDIADQQVPIEHCWVKGKCGTYYDPTYQMLIEQGKEIQTNYYSLVELTTQEYFEIVLKQRGEDLSKMEALDFMALRVSRLLDHYFSSAKK
ncbi:hypothetical protein [Vibrio parahaemolyticus]|uniref:hypothetical protein n=1 Tax=Vibrio parahaemolyticus TaxID=670 RepID=UPI003D817B06